MNLLFIRFTSAVYYPARKFRRTSSSHETTARVTTFFFPLFSLSGTPHGKVYHSFRNRCGPVVPRKVRALKTALPGRASLGVVSPSTYSFELPRNGVPQILHKTPLHVKLIFEKSFIFLLAPPRNHPTKH